MRCDPGAQQKTVKTLLFDEKDDIAHQGRIDTAGGSGCIGPKSRDVLSIQFTIIVPELTVAEETGIQEAGRRSADPVNRCHLAEDAEEEKSQQDRPSFARRAGETFDQGREGRFLKKHKGRD